MSVCRSVCRSVGLSVGLSVPSSNKVRNSYIVLSVASNLAQIICKRRLSIDSDILQSGYKQLFCSIRSNVDHANN